MPHFFLIAGDNVGVPILSVVHVDFCIGENGEAHNTSRYEIMERTSKKARLVVRRGQEFFVTITLNRDYDPTIDGISFVFTLEGILKPQYGHGTLVASALLGPNHVSEASWQCTVASLAENSVKVKVQF